MTLYIFLALSNGACIALSRIINGQLSSKVGAFKASYVNHLVGFVFLSVLLILFSTPPQLPMNLDIMIYLGGIIGALYVAINSFLIDKLGATNTMIMVISGQMVFGLVLEPLKSSMFEVLIELTGVALIIGGVSYREMIKRKAVSI